MSEDPFTGSFRDALADLLYLYDRGYPAKQVVELAGNRYRLSSVQRSLLRRGAVPEGLAVARRSKLLSPEKVAGRTLTIDSCNVLAVVGHYLSGSFVYTACDGLVRDAAESKGVFRKDARRLQAVKQMVSALMSLSPGGLRFYIDEPLAHSRDLARELRAQLDLTGLPATVEAVRSADNVLKAAGGVLVSGDSEIVDAVPEVFDLACYILTSVFNAELPDLRSLL